MKRFTTTRQLGDGTFGSVFLGKSTDSGELVAIKRMKRKFYSWDECVNLREVKSLKKLRHANVVKLKEVIRENDCLYFVFEYMKENLFELMKARSKLFPESVVRNMTFQILQGLSFIHKNGYFHRDLKPENLLCMGTELVKIADFGLARELRSLGNSPPYTEYVSTRWYRAPEVLLRSRYYSSPIDLWAVGCIVAELYTLRPLFPGTSEVDEVFKICQVLGTFKKSDWPEGYSLATSLDCCLPRCVSTSLRSLVPNASREAITVMENMLQWDPHKRPTAVQALRQPYFHVGQELGPPARYLEAHKAPAPAPAPSLCKDDLEAPALGEKQTQTRDRLPLLPQGPSKDHGCPIAIAPPSTLAQPPPLSRGKNGQSRAAPQVWKNLSNGTRSGCWRWGQTPLHAAEGWDGSEAFIFKKPNIYCCTDRALRDYNCLSAETRRQSENNSVTRPPNSSRPTRTDFTASSARQHYLRHSRYVPGVNPLTGRQTAGGNLWDRRRGVAACKESGCASFKGGVSLSPSLLKPLPIRMKSMGWSVRLAQLATPIPCEPSKQRKGDSFLSRTHNATGERISSTALAGTSAELDRWRGRTVKAKPAGPHSRETERGVSLSRKPCVAPVHGRVDWSAKYGGNRNR